MKKYTGVYIRLLHLMYHRFYRMRVQFIDENRIIVVHERINRFVNGVAKEEWFIAEIYLNEHDPKIGISELQPSISNVKVYLRRMTDARIVAEKLLQANAIKLSPQDPFTWASGWKSPIYCDNRRVLSFPFI